MLLLSSLSSSPFSRFLDPTVAHHLSSKIPHYHAWEATEALKNFLGEHYNYTDEPMFLSLWKAYRQCRFVSLL